MSWTREQVFDYLRERPRVARLATASPDGEPHVAPVWFDVDGEELVVHTLPHSVKTRNLEATGRFAITVDDDEWPYRGVILRGSARIAEPDAFDVDAWIRRLAIRYLGEEEGGAMADAMVHLPGHTMVILTPERWHGMTYSRYS